MLAGMGPMPRHTRHAWLKSVQMRAIQHVVDGTSYRVGGYCTERRAVRQ
jgi:hypothetical protein